MPAFSGHQSWKQADFLQGAYGPEQQIKETNRLVQAFMGNPMLAQALSGATGAGNRFGSLISQRLGASGGGKSGVGALAGAAGQSAGSFARSGILGEHFNKILMLALQGLMARMGKQEMAQRTTATDVAVPILSAAAGGAGAAMGAA